MAPFTALRPWKGDVLCSQSQPFKANWENTLSLSSTSTEGQQSLFATYSFSKKQQNDKTKLVQIPTKSSSRCREHLDILLTEILHTKLEIQNYQLLISDYIQLLSLYILYTNIIILLLNIIIIIIIIFYTH